MSLLGEHLEMVREVCSCGAEFESDESNAVRLLREWRRKHRCVNVPGSTIVVDSARVSEAPDFVVPELHIGFRADPDEE